MKGQDIVVLLKLVSLEDQIRHGRLDPSDGPDPFAMRGLEESLGISKTEISASLRRSLDAKLAIKPGRRPKTNRRNLTEFVLHGLKYAFPVRPGAPQRGIGTGFAAPMLKGQLVSSGADIHVWPYAEGRERGLSVEPLYPCVPDAVLKDDQLYALLALIDAIRLGNQREANLAKDLFAKRVAPA